MKLLSMVQRTSAHRQYSDNDLKFLVPATYSIGGAAGLVTYVTQGWTRQRLVHRGTDKLRQIKRDCRLAPFKKVTSVPYLSHVRIPHSH